ncbi:MAG: hypothetical protein ACI8WB_002469, partial [Phenylobacterium sp.]
ASFIATTTEPQRAQRQRRGRKKHFDGPTLRFVTLNDGIWSEPIID